MRACNMLILVTFLFLWVEISCAPSKTENTKRGSCPKPAVLRNSTAPCDNKCLNDSDCSEHMKCCDTGCGLRCEYAEKTGFCPFNDLPLKDGEKQKPKCKSDFDCAKNAKCCDRESSRDCLPASKEKPGKCPPASESKSEPQCSGDQDCPDNLKCCSNSGQRCMVPEKVIHAVPVN